MKKWNFKFTILAIFIILSVAILLINKEPIEASKSEIRLFFNSTSACLADRCFDVKLADTQEEREKGLMFVTNMSDKEGMLFIFEKSGIYSFWMKNTVISLDILWFDADKNIVFIKKNVQPCKADPCETINPGKTAKYVLEINAGLADKLSLNK